MDASLFCGGGSVIGEACPEQSAVYLDEKMRGRWCNARMGRYFAQTDCAGIQGSPFRTRHPTLTSDSSCRLILSSAILTSVLLQPRPSVDSDGVIQARSLVGPPWSTLIPASNHLYGLAFSARCVGNTYNNYNYNSCSKNPIGPKCVLGVVFS